MVQGKSRTLPKSLMWTGNVLICLLVELGCLVAIDTLHIELNREQQTQLSEAELQAAKNFLGVNFTPEELTAIEITPDLRDRLLTDPRAQSIRQAVRQDLIGMKWGGGGGESPVWVKYGAKAFPLLDYYTQSTDPTRQRYGMEGIFYLGKPYTTLWLKKQIKRRSHSEPNGWGPTRNGNGQIPFTWPEQFGLDSPTTRNEMIRLARENLNPKTDPHYHDQFNLRLLEELGIDLPADFDSPRSPSYEEQEKEREKTWFEWNQLKKLKRLNPKQVQQAFAFYRNLSADNKRQLLKYGWEDARPGTLSVVEQTVAQRLMADQTSPNQLWAIALLTWHGNAAASAQMGNILNGDLSQLNNFTQFSADWGVYAVLRDVAKKYPYSRFTQGCREYGDLTGRPYFGEELRDLVLWHRLKQKTSVQKIADWQDWLNRYPDHPGADDATDHLACSFLEVNNAVAATRLWVKMMVHPIGDDDARLRAYPRVRVMLDVGLSTEQIQQLLQDSELAAAAPLLRYALAVHFARDQDYANALNIGDRLNITRMSRRVLGSYYQQQSWRFFNSGESELTLQQQMQAMLIEQRSRWHQLLQWQRENTSDAHYKIASNWASGEGWKNGYLPVWQKIRYYRLPTRYVDFIKPVKGNAASYVPDDDPYAFDPCRKYWVCDLSRRGEQNVRTAYQRSSANAVALYLYQELLDNPRTSASIREKTLYMVAMTLLRQWENLDQGETQRIHPPAGVVASAKYKQNGYDGSYFVLKYDVITDYQHRIDSIILEMQKKFPKSRYIDDLLFSSYFLSGEQRHYLEQLVQQYPKGDRAQEARVLLNRPQPNN